MGCCPRLAAPELQPFVDQIRGLEDQIAAQQAAITGKRQEIEAVRAEHAG